MDLLENEVMNGKELNSVDIDELNVDEYTYWWLRRKSHKFNNEAIRLSEKDFYPPEDKRTYKTSFPYSCMDDYYDFAEEYNSMLILEGYYD